MKAAHTWMEYQYRYVNANENNKMWLRDDERIFQLSNGKFTITVDEVGTDAVYDSFVDAEVMIAQVRNDN